MQAVRDFSVLLKCCVNGKETLEKEVKLHCMFL